MFPIGDEPNEHRFAWVNYALLGANVLVFLIYQGAGSGASYDASIRRHAYVPADPSFTTAFTSMFLHGSWMHLIGNMLYLWVFGDNVEARLGHLGYLAAYLATGLAAGMVHGMVDPASAVPSLGASGAISGVQGLYLVAFPHNRVKMLFFFFYIIRVVLVPALWVILFWFFVQVLIPFLTDKSLIGGVAHGAHLGGFLAGVVLCFVLRPFFGPRSGDERVRDRLDPRRGEHAPGPSAPAPGGRRGEPWLRGAPPAPGNAPSAARTAWPTADPGGLWRSGRAEDATRALLADLRGGRRPGVTERDYIEMALWLERNGRYDDALDAFKGFLETYPSGRGAPLAALGAGLVLVRHRGDREAAKPWLEEALSSPYADDAVRAAARRELDA